MNNRSNDEQAVHQLLGETARGLYNRDASAATQAYSPEAVLYTLAPPLIAPMGEPSMMQEWLDTWSSPISVTHRNVTVEVDGGVAFAHGLSHMAGTKTDGQEVDLWYRSSWGFRRIDGIWTIIHEHESVPFLMDGSNKAALDLKP